MQFKQIREKIVDIEILHITLFSKIYNESLLQSMNAMVNAAYLSPQTHNSSELCLELTIKKKELAEVSALFYISSLNRYVQI